MAMWQPELDGEAEQPRGRIEPLGTRVDLDRHLEAATGFEDDLRVELELRPAAADDDPTGAVTEHIGEWVGDGHHHALGHLVAGHAQLRMHAGHHQVELGEQPGLLVEAAVLVDVDLDAGEDAKGGQLPVELRNNVELLAQRARRRAHWRR